MFNYIISSIGLWVKGFITGNLFYRNACIQYVKSKAM